jgi:putative transposase
MIEFTNDDIPVSRQCELLGLSRSTLYYRAREISEFNLKIMNELDIQYLKTPFYGSRRMTVILQQKGYEVNRKRVQRLMKIMGIHAIYPGRNLSKACKNHEIYPYLLRDMAINYANQVWSSDITYIRLDGGFIYLVAIMDWYSRKVLSWEVSITLESDFCIRALESALMKYGNPEIFNTDQGVQFTDKRFTKILKSHGIKISMDGKGRASDNIFIERLWRSLKYEEVYLKNYESVKMALENLRRYFEFYNQERPHQALGYQTVDDVYRESINDQIEGRKGA